MVWFTSDTHFPQTGFAAVKILPHGPPWETFGPSDRLHGW